MKLDVVIDAVIGSIQGEIDSYQDMYPDDNVRKGKIGELFFGRAVKYCLLDMGYYYNTGGGESSFWIERQINADKKEEGGIDFRVTVVDGNEEKYTFLLESKNWADYKTKISPNTFKKEILDRFTRIDRKHHCIWVVTMNKGNIDDILPLCKKYEIDIISVDCQLTTDMNFNEILKPLIRSFIDNFQRMIINYIDESKQAKSISNESKNKSDKDRIIKYIREGVPDQIIIKKFSTTAEYIQKIKSQMRKDGEEIIDRRSKEAKHLRKL